MEATRRMRVGNCVMACHKRLLFRHIVSSASDFSLALVLALMHSWENMIKWEIEMVS